MNDASLSQAVAIYPAEVEGEMARRNGLLLLIAWLLPWASAHAGSYQFSTIADTNAGGLLTLAFLFTLWSSSSAVVALCSTLNAAYDITEGRPWWKVRLTALGLTLGLALFILVSMTLVIAGPSLAEKIAEMARLGPAFVWTWKILQWPVVFVIVSIAIAIVYYFAPDEVSPVNREPTP